MNRKFLTILLALVMTLIIIPCSASEGAAVTDGQMIEISFDKNADTIVTPETVEGNVQATINPDTWFGGIQDSYGSGFLDQGFGGYPAVKFTDDGFTFKEKVYDTTNAKLITDFAGAKTYNIPYTVPEGELDSFIFTNIAPYGKENAPTSLTINLKQTRSTSVFLAMNMRADFSLSPKVKYTDGIEVALNSIRCIGYPQYGTSQKDRFDNVTTETTGETVTVKEKTNDLSVRIAGDISWSGIKLFMTDLGTTDETSGELVRDTIASQTSNGRTAGLILYELRLDSEKIPDTLTITSSTKYPAVLYTVSQQEITNAEFMESVTKAEAIEPGMLNADEISLIKKAAADIEILKSRNYDYDFSKVEALVGYAESQEKLVGIQNISFEKNADTLITADAAKTAVINPDTWFAGLLDSYDGGLFEQGFSGGDLSTYNGKIENGNMTFYEKVYDTTNAKLITDFEGARTFKIPVNALTSDELDSYILSTSVPYGKETAPSKLTVALNDIPSTSLYIVSNRRGASSFKATVYYKDGSEESSTISSVQSNNASATASIYDQVTSVTTDGKTVITRNPAVKAKAVSTIDTGYASYITTKMADNGGERDITAADFGNMARTLVLHEIILDSSKIPEKVVFETSVIYPAAIYSIAQEQVSVDEMIAVLDEVEAMKVTDAQFSEKVQKAKNYRKVLSAYGIISENAYPNISTEFDEMLLAEKPNYIDLSEYVDTDLIVERDSQIISNGRSDNGLTSAANAYYDASYVAENGIIEMLAPQNEMYAAVNSRLSGQTFKLSGGYAGKGSDAVKLAPNSEKTVEINSSVTGIRKSLSVMLDSVYIGETKNPASVSAAVDIGGYGAVSAKINYDDGTSEETQVYLYKSTGYYHPDVFAHSSVMGRLYNDGEIYQHDSRGSGYNSFYMYASEIACNPAKTIESITFKNNSSNEYHILALTEFAYTNAELYNADISVLDNVNADDEFTSFGQVDALLEASNKALEGHSRKINVLSDEKYAKITAIRERAAQFVSDNANKIFLKEEGTDIKIVKISNTHAINKYYTLILAAYDENGALSDISTGKLTVINNGEYDVTDTISVTKADAKEYKLFVWEEAKTLKPVLTEEYPFN